MPDTTHDKPPAIFWFLVAIFALTIMAVVLSPFIIMGWWLLHA